MTQERMKEIRDRIAFLDKQIDAIYSIMSDSHHNDSMWYDMKDNRRKMNWERYELIQELERLEAEAE